MNTDCLMGIWRETGAHLVSCITLVCFVTVAYKFDQGIWRETGAHLVSCITLVCFVTVAYKFDQRILNAQGLF